MHLLTSASTAPPAEEAGPRRSRRSFLGLAGRAGTIGVAASVVGLADPLASVAGAATSASAATAATTAGAEGELAYAETTVDCTTTGSVLIPNVVISVGTSTGPIVIEYGAHVMSSATNGLVKLYLVRDSTGIHEVGCTVTNAKGVNYLRGLIRIPAAKATAGTYAVMLSSWATGATAHAVGMPTSPAFILARRA